MSQGITTFSVPTKIVFGVGAVAEIGEKVRSLTPSRAVLVTTPEVIGEGWVDEVKDLLSMSGIATTVYGEVAPNPRLDLIKRVIEEVNFRDGDVVVGVGGGSAIDTSKAMALLWANPGELADFAGYGRVPNPAPPVVAVPTISGMGSEVSCWTALVDPEKRAKVMIGSPFITPAWAICDPELTLTVPPEVTATAGLGALSHAIESYVTRDVSQPSESLSLGAVELIGLHLQTAYERGDHLAARSKVMMGSLMAGMALNNVGLGLVEALAAALSGFLDVPHGLISAVILPRVMELNLPACTGRYAALARALNRDTAGRSAEETARQAVSAVSELIEGVGLGGVRLSDLGLKEEDIDKVSETCLENEVTRQNPVIVDKSSIADIIREAM